MRFAVPAWRSSTWSSCSTAGKAARKTSAKPGSRTPRCTAFKTSSLTELLIKGGTVYTPDGARETDVLITDGVITRVEPSLRANGKVLDAKGLYVLPGGVDAHVHSRDPGFPEKEDFASLTEAAAAGGITTVVDMPNTVPAVESAAVFAEKVELASSRALVDFALWGLLGSGSRGER